MSSRSHREHALVASGHGLSSYSSAGCLRRRRERCRQLLWAPAPRPCVGRIWTRALATLARVRVYARALCAALATLVCGSRESRLLCVLCAALAYTLAAPDSRGAVCDVTNMLAYTLAGPDARPRDLTPVATAGHGLSPYSSAGPSLGYTIGAESMRWPHP
jgi:hypothetical protein